jgi:hypothetical protein
MGFLGSKRSASAKAQVLGEHDGLNQKWSPAMGGITESSSLHMTCKLRVVPDDGRPEFESQLSLWGNSANYYLTEGRWTYVRYNPDKPDKCDLDVDRIVKEFGRNDRTGMQAVMIPTNVSDAWGLGTGSVGAGPGTPSSFVPPSMTRDFKAKTGAPASNAGSKSDVADELTKLADLLGRGLLSQAEFDAQKAKLLDQN